nr:DedA family integral membrane protein [Salmonella sp. NCTC 7297]
MQALLEHFITQSALYSLIAVLLVAFLESLALVGLILPGTVLMAGLGALIGSGELNFWHAWGVGIIGCLMGDWISFWLGWRFKKPLHRWSFMKKNKSLLDKTEHALHQHSMFTILVGRFVGPDEAAGADGGRDAGSARGEIYWAELDWLFVVAAVLFPAGHSGWRRH